MGSLGAGEHPRGVHRPLPALPAVPPPPIPRPIPARGGTSQKRHQASRAARGGTAQPFPPPGAQKSRTVRLPRGRQRPRKGSEALRRLRVRHPLPPGCCASPLGGPGRELCFPACPAGGGAGAVRAGPRGAGAVRGPAAARRRSSGRSAPAGPRRAPRGRQPQR